MANTMHMSFRNSLASLILWRSGPEGEYPESRKITKGIVKDTQVFYLLYKGFLETMTPKL